MSKSKQFFLQTIFILSVALVPSLFVIRIFQPVKAIARVNLISGKKEEQIFLNPLVTLAQEEEVSSDLNQVKVSPTLISIPGKGVTLPVSSGEIVDDEWTLYEDRVAWLSTSSEPGKGNVILYAHNQKHLFRPLHELRVADEIVLEHNGWEYVYIVSETRTVEPSEINAVLSSENQLTLYTCDGVFDQRRLVVLAKPAGSF